MHIERATRADDELVAAFARLIPQLNPDAPLPGRDDLTRVVASPDTYLLIARDPDIVGSLTLTLYHVPTGLQGRINTVVVDAAARGRGLGEALTREAVRIARDAGTRRITLSSRAERVAANRMYRRVGFQLTVTNAYHMTL